MAWFALFALSIVAAPSTFAEAVVPEQVHLALTGQPGEMAVDFVTPTPVPACSVHASAATGSDVSSPAASVPVPEIGVQHQALLRGLLPETRYNYSIACGPGNVRGGLWFKTAPPQGSQAAADLTTIFFADYGLVNDVSNDALIAESEAADLVIHGGDIAYNLFTNESRIGNEFMRAVEGFASRIPYMVVPGNHEKGDNFTQVVQRFNSTRHVAETCGSNNQFFYSFDFGLIHYVAIMTEQAMFPEEVANSPLPFVPNDQLRWLEADLAKADARRKANSSAPQWIVMYGHKGWDMDFEPDKKHLAKHKLTGNFTAFSPLADRYSVDLYLTGHVHLYQRFVPLLASPVHAANQRPKAVDRDCMSDDNHIYTNPRYLTTIVAGSPGDQELTQGFMCPGESIIQPETLGLQPVCRAAYGYGLLRAPNATHLHWVWQQTGKPSTSDQGVDIVAKDADYQDHLWIVRTDRDTPRNH